MSGWLIVAGDFTLHAGMDGANLELARFLAVEDSVHVVAHHVAAELRPNVTVHRAARPLQRHLLGQPFLARIGRRWAARLAQAGFRVVVNGGNCRWPDANWVDYVHAAAPPQRTPGLFRKVISRFASASALRAECAALRMARVVVCNSHRTGRDAVELVGVREDRVRVVYLGTDSERFPLVRADERLGSRGRLGWADCPWAVFVGSLGDSRKGFDTLYAARRELCRDSRWDANLAVVGAGATLANWQSCAVADGLANRVRFLGFRTDVPDILAASDVLVHPARYEPYGMGVHEALCRGLPAIVSTASGVSERYPPDLVDLILPDPENATELADRLRHWRANLESLAIRVRPLADQLRSRSWANMACELRDTVLAAP